VKLGKQADKARDAMNDFDAGKAAETAAPALSDLKDRAAETLNKAGVTAAVSGGGGAPPRPGVQGAGGWREDSLHGQFGA